jgi:hypothetical protein
VTCKDGRGEPAERSLFARSEMSAAMPVFQATIGAGIGGVIPPDLWNHYQAPLFPRFHCPGLRGVFAQG